MSQLFYYIYRISLPYTVLIILLIGPVWGLLMWLVAKAGPKTGPKTGPKAGPKAVRALNAVLAAVALAGIVYITVLRPDGSKREVILQPLQSFVEAKQQREMYRELLMNVLLFVPLGLTLPFALAPAGRVQPRHAWIALAFALALSVAIEAVQYVYALGRCETDDVISNVVGAAFGACACWVFCLLSRHRHD